MKVQKKDVGGEWIIVEEGLTAEQAHKQVDTLKKLSLNQEIYRTVFDHVMIEGTMFSDIQMFNTGRQYTPQGQIIYWSIFDDGANKGIIFRDISRCITSQIPLPGEYGIDRFLGKDKPVKTVYYNINKEYIMTCYDGSIHLARPEFTTEATFNRIIDGILFNETAQEKERNK